MRCNACGKENVDNETVCSVCGLPLSRESAEDTTIIYSPHEVEIEKNAETVTVSLDELREDSPVLLVLNGPNKGETFRLDKESVLLGRHPEADVFLSDITVSREHARIRKEGATYNLIDNGSLNGTYHNRHEIERAELQDEDEIQIGKFKMMFLREAKRG